MLFKGNFGSPFFTVRKFAQNLLEKFVNYFRAKKLGMNAISDFHSHRRTSNYSFQKRFYHIFIRTNVCTSCDFALNKALCRVLEDSNPRPFGADTNKKCPFYAVSQTSKTDFYHFLSLSFFHSLVRHRNNPQLVIHRRNIERVILLIYLCAMPQN